MPPVTKGLLPLKEAVGWRATAGEMFPLPRLSEAVSFTDFHEHGFMILASDFHCSFLQDYGVQLQHLPPNAVSQQAGFIVVSKAFLGIEPNKDLFRWVFKVKTCKAHGSDVGVLAPVGSMNIKMCHGVFP